ncbi:hypothetical protein HMPREF3190_01321 [Umbribacter vaginalis]|nr:hypothetical protein HMPREF3190_01321 [Coriobacteriales bacterium DNF00809]
MKNVRPAGRVGYAVSDVPCSTSALRLLDVSHVSALSCFVLDAAH